MKKTFFTLAMTSFQIILAFAIAIPFSVLGALAVGADGIPFWTDTGVVICDTTDDQTNPQIIGDGSGGAIVVWEDNRSGNYDIYAQRIDASGNPLWTTDGVVICDTSGNQLHPRLVSDGLGGAIIAWEDTRSGPGYYDIYAQRIDGDGYTLWPDNGTIVCGDTNTQYDPRLAEDGSGGAVIVWEDYRNDLPDIYGQRVDINGNTIWTHNGVAICDTTDVQHHHQLIADGLGGAIIVWSDTRINYMDDIYAQRLDADGNPIWTTNGVLICAVSYYQEWPRLVSDGSGGAIIVWQDLRPGTHYDIYSQRVDAEGYCSWDTNGIAVCYAVGTQHEPNLIGDGYGGAIIVWQDHRNDNTDIYAQRIDADGDPLWTNNGVVICDADSDQGNPWLAEDGSGGAIITWMDPRNGYDYGIYAQRVADDGNLRWIINGVTVCDTIGDQMDPHLASDGSGGAIIVWEDYRSGREWDIYAQRVNHNGTVGPVPYIASINDVPNDQGKQVLILWDRSYLDDQQYQVITYYSIWRRHLGGSKIMSIGEEWNGTPPKELSKLVYRRIERKDRSGISKTEYWEYLGSVDAHFFEGYAYIAPTLEDSSASGIPYFTFLVSAQTADPFVFWDSAPDSGYSVDNINPAKTQMTAIASGTTKGSVNTVWLSWDQVTTGVDGSPEKGPIRYRVYYDTDPDFMLGPGNLLTETSALGYPHHDARIGDPAANLFYLVIAIDASDNESAISNMVGEFDLSLTNSK